MQHGTLHTGEVTRTVPWETCRNTVCRGTVTEMEEIVIRAVTQEDMEQVRTLYRSHIAYNEKTYMSAGEGPALQAECLARALGGDLVDAQSIAATYGNDGCFLVATLSGAPETVVGIAGLQDLGLVGGEKAAELRRMTVHEAHRKLKIGTKIVAALERHARSHGFARIDLETMSGFITAVGFYLSSACGFVQASQPGPESEGRPWGGLVTFSKRLV